MGTRWRRTLVNATLSSMDIYEALYTTRAHRRVKPDPIPEHVQKQILDAAVRAPTGGNAQGWRFLLVDSPDVKRQLGPLYRECLETLFGTLYKAKLDAAKASPDDPQSIDMMKMYRSAMHLGEKLEAYPLLLFAFCQGDPTGSSIYPAVWSAMLAARGHGVGTAITSVLLFKNDEVLSVLGVPADSGWQMNCMVTFGYPTGPWRVAPRTPAHRVAYRNAWGSDVGFEIPDPMFRMDA